MNINKLKVTSMSLSVKKYEFINVNALFILLAIGVFFFCGAVHAADAGTDLLADVFTGSVGKTLGSQSKFWKIFILFDVILAAAAAVKSKNPLVFGGVFITAFLPGILLKSLVFTAAA